MPPSHRPARGGRRPARASAIVKADTFGSSRTGARNIAGVNFQALASCHLLIRSCGLVVDRLRPEGDEDCDLFVSSGDGAEERLIRVQVKFRSQGLTCVELADALVKAWVSGSSTPPENREIAVCVNALALDAPLLSGWESSIADTLETLSAGGEEIGGRLQRAVEAALSHAPERPTLKELLSRSHVIQVSSSFGDLARAVAAEYPFVTDFHAQLATARLLDRLLRTAADNREASGPSGGHVLDRHAVASIMAETAAATGSWVNEIVSRRLVSVPNFDRQPRDSRMAFLRGVRARPEHVGAGYAVSRPRWLEALQDVVDRGSSALLVGPSGSGKSTLMWQAAASRQQMKVFALTQVLETDVGDLASFFRLMAPADGSPLLVCADDVDRPVLVGWSALLRELGADAQIRFIGTCREERFDPALTASGVATPLRPRLESSEAIDLARSVLGHSVRTDGDLTTLYRECDGLLMEFVHAATTSRYLFDVLDEQAALLLELPAPTQAVARVVLAADVCNISLPVEKLRHLGYGDHEISTSLRRLNAEHVLIDEGSGLVRGLHPLRSQHLLTALHRFLPRLSETLSILVQVADARELRVLMEAWVREAPADIELLEEALARRISSDVSLDVRTVAELLYRSEASVFARDLHNWLSSADADLFDALLLGRMGSRAEGMSLLTVGVWDAPLGGQLMQESLPVITRYSKLHEEAPLPRPVRRHVISQVAVEGRARLANGLSRSLAGLRYFVASEAFEKAELVDMMRACVQACSGDALVAGFGYDGHRAGALVEVTNQRIMVSIVAAIARSSSLGPDAAEQVFGADARSRVIWALQRGPAGLISVDPKFESVYSPEATLVAPVTLLDGARTGVQNVLYDAIAIAGRESIRATILKADGQPIDQEVFGYSSVLAPAPLPNDLLNIVLQQDSTLRVGGSWFDWLGDIDESMAVAATATEMTVSFCIESLHRVPNLSTLRRLLLHLDSAMTALEVPIVSPARPSRAYDSRTRDAVPAIEEVYTPALLQKGISQIVGLCRLVLSRSLGTRSRRGASADGRERGLRCPDYLGGPTLSPEFSWHPCPTTVAAP